MYQEAKNFLMNELDRRASGAGQQVSSTAGQLRKIAEELRSDDLSRPAAQLADRGAQTLEEIGRYLEQSKGDRLLADAEHFGRERPWILATAGVALGLAGSRMLKASAARRYRSEDYDGADEAGAGRTYSAPSYGSRPSGTDFGASDAPISSDAAPYKAARQGASPATTTFESGGAYGSPAATPATGAPGISKISKSAEAQRLTNSDGS